MVFRAVDAEARESRDPSDHAARTDPYLVLGPGAVGFRLGRYRRLQQ
jgi:hypothetical protein